jgi:hypothetical protein
MGIGEQRLALRVKILFGGRMKGREIQQGRFWAFSWPDDHSEAWGVS